MRARSYTTQDIRPSGKGARPSISTTGASFPLPKNFDDINYANRWLVQAEAGQEFYVSLTPTDESGTISEVGGWLVHAEGGPMVFHTPGARFFNAVIPSGGGSGFCNVVPLDD